MNYLCSFSIFLVYMKHLCNKIRVVSDDKLLFYLYQLQFIIRFTFVPPAPTGARRSKSYSYQKLNGRLGSYIGIDTENIVKITTHLVQRIMVNLFLWILL